jgi:hypothetical protein
MGHHFSLKPVKKIQQDLTMKSLDFIFRVIRLTMLCPFSYITSKN